MIDTAVAVAVGTTAATITNATAAAAVGAVAGKVRSPENVAGGR